MSVDHDKTNPDACLDFEGCEEEEEEALLLARHAAADPTTYCPAVLAAAFQVTLWEVLSPTSRSDSFKTLEGRPPKHAPPAALPARSHQEAATPAFV